jgi:UDP-glucose 4-epimerase
MTGTVLVTGASGFLGQHVVPGLAARGWRVHAAARHPADMLNAPASQAVTLPDLSKPVRWEPLLEGVTHVVHLAGIAHAGPGVTDADFERVNAEATGELARAARTRVERVVLASSVRAQCGPVAEGVLTEDTPADPSDAYGRSKLHAERLLAESGAPWVGLRSVLVYGSGVRGNMAALARLARSGLPLPFGALRNRRSLLAVENLIAAIDAALRSDAALGRSLLVADAEPVTLPEIITALRRGLGRRPGLVPVPPALLGAALRAAGKHGAWRRLSGDLVVDTSALQAIGWRPEIETKDALARMMGQPRASAS